MSKNWGKRKLRFEQLEKREVLSAVISNSFIAHALVIAAAFLALPFDPASGQSLTYEEAVAVTNTHIRTAHDNVPRFAANPDHVAVKNGLWSDPGTWGGGTPGTDALETITQIEAGALWIDGRIGEDVSIPLGVTVVYDEKSSTKIGSIELAGTLKFATDMSTCLFCDDITILPGGSLIVGSEDDPIPANLKAEIVFCSTRHLIEEDPGQHGTGVLCFGNVTVHGSLKTPFIASGESPVGWLAEDRLLVPDMRQIPLTSFSPAFTSQAQVGPGLTAPEDGHAANLTRNVILRSETPDDLTTRGHAMCFSGAEVDVNNAAFVGLGRTSANIRRRHGTDANKAGRYSFHLHHMHNTDASVKGCVFEDFMLWAFVLHETNNAKCVANVFYNGRGNYLNHYAGESGAAIATETGNEIGNQILGNFICHSEAGSEQRILGAPGAGIGGIFRVPVGRDGIWCTGPGNDVIENIVTNCPDVGINLNGYQTTGTGMIEPVSIGTWRNNTVYGCTGHGVWVSYSQGRFWLPSFHREPQMMANFLIRNCSRSGLYDWGSSAAMNYTGWVIQADPDVSSQSSGTFADFGDVRDIQNVGMAFGDSYYANLGLVVSNCTVTGFNTGIKLPFRPEMGKWYPVDHAAFSNLTLGNHINCEYRSARATIDAEVRLANINFLRATIPAGDLLPGPADIWMHLDQRDPHTNIIDQSRLLLDNKRIYYYEQAADYIIPPYNPSSPGAGLTNQEAWDTLGIAIGDEIAPSNAVDGAPSILGYIINQ